MRQIYLAAAILALAGTAVTARAESKTTVSGKAFADLTYKDSPATPGTPAVPATATTPAVAATPGRTSDKGIGVDVKRFYVVVEHSFDEVWGARFTSDIGNLASGKVNVFVKHAYIEAKLAPELGLRLGSADMPWVGFVDGLYGFRYVENTLTDRLKVANSADWGVHAGGKFANGMVNYAISMANGRGYSDWTRSKTPTFEGRLGVAPIKPLMIAIGGEVGKLGLDSEGNESLVPAVTTPRTAQRLSGLVAWVDGGFRLGGEAFWAKNHTAALVRGAPEDKAIGASAWASFMFYKDVTVFGRFDWEKPAKDTNNDLRDIYFNAGLEYKPVKAVNLALVFKHDDLGTSARSATVSELGLFTQYTF